MARYFLILIVSLCAVGVANAQVIDDSAINDAQNNGYSFVEGMFVAYLADTVSPGFIRKAFADLELVIMDEQIKPMVIAIVNFPSKESVEKLRDHPKVRAFLGTPFANEKDQLDKMLNNSSFTEEQKEQIKKEANPVETYLIEMDYSVNKVALKKIMGAFRDVAYRIISDQPKSVTVKAEAGNEPLLMDKVEQLNFVVSTAMIGTVRN